MANLRIPTDGGALPSPLGHTGSLPACVRPSGQPHSLDRVADANELVCYPDANRPPSYSGMGRIAARLNWGGAVHDAVNVVIADRTWRQQQRSREESGLDGGSATDCQLTGRMNFDRESPR
jgi:hypothetical protein